VVFLESYKNKELKKRLEEYCRIQEHLDKKQKIDSLILLSMFIIVLFCYTFVGIGLRLDVTSSAIIFSGIMIYIILYRINSTIRSNLLYLACKDGLTFEQFTNQKGMKK